MHCSGIRDLCTAYSVLTAAPRMLNVRCDRSADLCLESSSYISRQSCKYIEQRCAIAPRELAATVLMFSYAPPDSSTVFTISIEA